MKTYNLATNNHGNDYVVSNIQGRFAVLDQLLERVDFDPAVDRLFATGELTDNIIGSNRILEYINTLWFYSIKGAAEQKIISGKFDDWYLALSPNVQKCIVAELSRLPEYITINHRPVYTIFPEKMMCIQLFNTSEKNHI
jgi:hypothetical protein